MLATGDRLKVTIELPTRRIVSLQLDDVEQLLEPAPASYYHILVSQFGWSSIELVAVDTSGEPVTFDPATLLELGRGLAGAGSMAEGGD